MFFRPLSSLWFGSLITLFLLFSSSVANAQGPSTTATDVSTGATVTLLTNEFVEKEIEKPILGAIITSIINLLTFAADRAAYDAATALVAGGPADSPLYDGTPWGEFYKGWRDAVAGEAIGLLQDDLEALSGSSNFAAVLANFNLCSPNADVTLMFLLDIQAKFKQPKPKCDIFQVQNNWKGFVAGINAVTDGDPNTRNTMILTQLADAYNPGKNDLAVGLAIRSKIFNKVLEDSQLKLGAHIKDSGTVNVVDFITGNIQTPADILNKTTERALAGPAKTRGDTNLALLSAAPAALIQVGIHAGSVFTNTALSGLTKKLYSGLFDVDYDFPDPFSDFDQLSFGSVEERIDQFQGLLAINTFSIDNYSYIKEFAVCPISSRGLYNCVANASLVSAITRADTGSPLTVGQAIEDGLLNGGWPLIPESDLARNQDPFCYTYGFCYGNLVKLRKARILPVGWELAANSEYNTSDAPVLLQTLVDNFNNCNDQGERDANHQWCHLVDPDWVIKYPSTQCRIQVAGQLLQSPESSDRLQECVDSPSCISENANGECEGGYGYCVREENLWQFRGEECPVEYASCLTFDGEEGEESYLKNTVDYGICSAGNSGCTWYNTVKEDLTGVGDYLWPLEDNVAEADSATGTYLTRAYFNGSVGECDQTQAGCKELIERTPDLRLNLISNSSFEIEETNDGLPDGWLFTDGLLADYQTGITAGDGNDALNPGGVGAAYQVGLTLEPGEFYTLSFAYQADGLLTPSATAAVVIYSDAPSTDVNLLGTTIIGACGVVDSNQILNGDGNDDAIALSVDNATTAWQTATCTFTSPTISAGEVKAKIELTGTALVDEIMLEQGEEPSDYHTGYTTTDYSTIIAKVPPPYLECKGEATDPEACNDYAAVCSSLDVGCTAYIPKNGNPTITAVATALDACPAECSGYDTYKQESAKYDPFGAFPLYFIPETGESCDASAVGCSEFTNLTTEAKEYYLDLRACLTNSQADANLDSDNSAVYYTWEGSDLDGYQLKTWNLLESDALAFSYTHAGSGILDSAPALAPCASWQATDSGIICNDSTDNDSNGIPDWDLTICDEHADIYSNPDCREFYDADGNLHYRSFSRTITIDDACVAYRITTLTGLSDEEKETNCESSGGFYEVDSGECRYYGLTLESISCDQSENGCRSYTGGQSNNSRLVFTDDLEGGNINNWDTDSAENLILSNESLATDGHSLAATSAFTTFQYNHGSICTLEAGCPGTAEVFGGTCTVATGEQYCGLLHNQLISGKTYTVSFWAKGTGAMAVGFDFNAVNGNPAFELSFGTINLTPSWQEYSLGPLDMNELDYPQFGVGTALVFEPGALTYLDNITLREGEDDLTLIADSWVTPVSCDLSPTGTPSPQYHLGCQEYSTSLGTIAYEKSFSRLCEEKQVGCEDFFLTEESESVYGSLYNASCSSLDGETVLTPTPCYYETSSPTSYDTSSPFLCTIGIDQSACRFDLDFIADSAILPTHLFFGPETRLSPADGEAFLVINDTVTCDASGAGCRELGEPVYAADKNSTTLSNSVYLFDLPETYATTLCSNEELFCATWETSEQGTFYFKDPIDQTCSFEENKTVNGINYSGWFRTDTDDFCYGTCADGVNSCGSNADCGGDICSPSDPSYVINGEQSGIWRNGDTDYRGWVGACPSGESACTEFSDPLAIPDGTLYQAVDGDNYYAINDDQLSDAGLPATEQCDGQASLKAGCGLFNDTSDPSLKYNASATEVVSRHADEILGGDPYALVDPIDCNTDGVALITLPDGSEFDPCARRCVYDLGAVNDVTDGVSYAQKLEEESDSDNFLLYAKKELYLFGTSCFASIDCSKLTSENGAKVPAVGCLETVAISPDVAPNPDGVTTRLENDTNVVVKVDRDRQCSEWLTCINPQTIWDPRSSSYKTICHDIDLCTEYSAAGGSSFCTSPKQDDLKEVLDIELYASRDVSWYGDEYSGYAVPDIFPIESLEQKDIAPPAGFCNLFSFLEAGTITQDYFNENHGTVCLDDSGCEDKSSEDSELIGSCSNTSTPEYRLAYNAGTCELAYNKACAVGYCANTGAGCSTSDQCNDGASCLVGQCQQVIESDVADQSGCAPGSTFVSGECLVYADDLVIEDYNANIGDDPEFGCEANYTLAKNVAVKEGTCINESCLLAPSGQTFTVAETESKLCRGQPESGSPFANAVVTEWLDSETSFPFISGDSSNAGWEDEPYSKLQNFTKANTCALGQTCDCSYDKVTFESGEIRYFSEQFDINDQSTGNGLCSAGLVGKTCSDDIDCEDATIIPGIEGNCALPTTNNTFLGLDGYCLEKDSTLSKDGDRSKNPCLTWLPVDQLAGSTDLYAKFKGAGYFTDTYACSEVAPFVNLKMSDHSSIPGVACADQVTVIGQELDKGVLDPNVVATCLDHAGTACPEGFWALVGMPQWKDTGLGGSLADQCINPTNDCPFVCLPIGATTDDGESCDPEADNSYALKQLLIITDEDNFYETLEKTYIEQDLPTFAGYVGPGSITFQFTEADTAIYEQYDDLVEALTVCTLKGIPVTDQLNKFIFDLPAESDAFYYGLGLNGEFYGACSAVQQVADESDLKSYAWTDRLLGEENTTFALGSSDPSLQLTSRTTSSTSLAPYGLFESNPANEFSGWPVAVATCQTNPELGNSALQNPTGLDFISCVNPFHTYDEKMDTVGQIPSGILSEKVDPSSADSWGLMAFGYTSPVAEIGNFFGVGNFLSAQTILDDIFANTSPLSGLFEWQINDEWPTDLTTLNYAFRESEESIISSSLSLNFSDIRDEGNPPRLYALNLSNCEGTECEEGAENALTLNSQSFGDIEESNFFSATLKFYAAADKNQLPIRRVIIDWGDEVGSGDHTGSTAPDNLYQNHRGLEAGKSVSKCEQNNPEWGLTPESCDPNYFSYSHIYTCTAGEVLGLEVCTDGNDDGYPDSTPCSESFTGGESAQCVFRPRVHVRDNWGWCTGTCTGASDGNDGCFEHDFDTLNDLTEIDAQAECAYQQFPDFDPANNPWVYYDGVIRLSPVVTIE